MQNVSVRLVFDRKHVATKQTKGLVQIEVYFLRKRKWFSTGLKLLSTQWGKDNRVKNNPNAEIFNRRLTDQVADIYEFAHDLWRKGEVFTFEKLEEHLKGPIGQQPSFLEFMETRMKERPMCDGTRKHHQVILRKLRAFGRIKDFSDITPMNIRRWDEYAKSWCTSQASVYGYHKVLKIYVREAFASQLIKSDPYANLRLPRGGSSVRKFLTKEELAAVENAEIEDEKLRRVRDMFVFCCYTGLSYSDMCAFDFSDAKMDGGMYRLRGNRKKTGVEFNISLLSKAMEILRRYDFKLPVISNQKYNDYLKVIALRCGIKSRITSHVARHTFATTVMLANGVPIEVISKMLGHTNVQTTQLYAKVFQQEVNETFDRLDKAM